LSHRSHDGSPIVIHVSIMVTLAEGFVMYLTIAEAATVLERTPRSLLVGFRVVLASVSSEHG